MRVSKLMSGLQLLAVVSVFPHVLFAIILFGSEKGSSVPWISPLSNVLCQLQKQKS